MMKHLMIAGILSCFSMGGFAQIYKDKTAPVEDRTNDLLHRMTLEEKLDYIGGYKGFYIRGIERLGVPEIKLTDGPVGTHKDGKSTAYPAGVLTASTWNRELVYELGKQLGRDSKARGVHILLGPGVNIYRTPLNGRNFEYMGEDPYLASELCVPYIQGVQKNGVAACVKHYALNNQELWRGHIDVQLSDRALYEIYLPAFKAAVERGKTWSVMGAYNKVRGTHATHHKLLNNDILKGEWNFDGCVITDWGAAHDTYEAAMYGLDIEMGSYTNGLTSESEFGFDDYYLGKSYLKMVREDKAARVLRLIFRTAMNRRKPFGALTSEEHYRTAYEVATESIVLLKNGTGKKQPALLPVPQGKYKRILVVGDNATRNLMLGGGSSELKVQRVVSPLEGIKAKFGENVVYAQGYTSGRPMYGRADVIPQTTVDSLRNDAVKKAMNADLVIFVGGLNKNHFQDCEGGDRLSYGLPFGQNELIEALLKVNKNLVAVIVSGNAVEMPWVREVPSIIQSWYLGSVGGEALADVLSGDVNPSGKLPFSYPVKLEDCPAHFFGEISYPGDSIRQEYKEDILVGYRWYDTKKIRPLFPFGYGMSYTAFEYSKPAVSAKTMNADGSIDLTVKIKNTGEMVGKEIVQLYIGDEECSVLRPVKELKDFRKVQLLPNEEKEVKFTIKPEALQFFDDKQHTWVAEPGKFKAYIAASSSDIRGTVTFEYTQ